MIAIVPLLLQIVPPPEKPAIGDVPPVEQWAPPPKSTREKVDDRVAEMKRVCAVEWKNDFRMQAWCVTKSLDGFREFLRVYKELGTPVATALVKCIDEWQVAGDPNWQMIGWCAGKQAEGYRALQRTP